MKRKLKVFQTAAHMLEHFNRHEGEADRLRNRYEEADGTFVYCTTQENLRQVAGLEFLEVTFPDWTSPVPEKDYLWAKSLERWLK